MRGGASGGGCTSAVQWCAPVSAPDFTTRQPALAVKAGPIKNAHNFAAKETSFKMQTEKKNYSLFWGLGLVTEKFINNLNPQKFLITKKLTKQTFNP